jgi:hypothetical protein
MSTITRNGKAFDSADVTIELLGNEPNEVYELNYNTDQEHQLNYSLGSKKPTSWSMGKESHQASITLSMLDTAQIESAARKKGLSKITEIAPFNIVVRFFNEFNEQVIDRITCKFASTGRAIGGEQALRYQHNLFVLEIKYNQLIDAGI